MRIALLAVKWIAGCLLGLTIIIGLCWWLIPDEELNKEADKFVSQAPAPPAANNAYFMLWGFTASPELDPHQVGRQIVAAHDRIVAAEKDLSKFKLELFYGERPYKNPKDTKRLCDVEKENCLRFYQGKQAEIRAQSDELKVYLVRYRQIREYQDFGMALSQATFQTPIIPWAPILRMSELVDGNIAGRMTSKDTQRAALQELAAEVSSWRRLLQGNDWLITQMVSVAALARKYRLASEIMSAYPEVVVAYPEIMEKITAPLQPANTNIVAGVAAEARLAVGTFRGMQAKGGFLEDSVFEGMPGPPLRAAFAAGGFRQNATLNEAYAYFNRLLASLVKSPKQLQNELAAGNQGLTNHDPLKWSDVFYNPVGRITNRIAEPDYFQYAIRIHDLIGFSRLVDLERRVVASNVPTEGVASFLAGAGSALTDPYTEQPMQWDAANKRVWFAPEGKRLPFMGYVTLGHLK
jgi:hypothetical protein